MLTESRAQVPPAAIAPVYVLGRNILGEFVPLSEGQVGDRPRFIPAWSNLQDAERARRIEAALEGVAPDVLAVVEFHAAVKK